MVAVPFHVAHLRPMAAVVAAHGATDLDSWRWPPWYVACCFAPAPPLAVTTLFVASSVVHFAEDVGRAGSLLLHALAGVATLLGGAQVGLELVTLYLACVHTPLHYARCWRRGRWGALLFAALATYVALHVVRLLDVVWIGHATQRVVAAHVWTEWSVGRKSEE